MSNTKTMTNTFPEQPQRATQENFEILIKFLALENNSLNIHCHPSIKSVVLRQHFKIEKLKKELEYE